MNASNLPIGLVHGIAAADYHADPGVSNTMLSALNKSPAHCFALHLAEDRPAIESTPTQLAGTLAHAMILEPETIEARYVIRPDGMDFRTKAGRAWRDAQTLEVVDRDQFEVALGQREAILRVPELAAILRSGHAEASAFWIDKATRLRCRARPDWLHFASPKRATALDVKSISDLTHDAVQRAIGAYGYHRQEAHYTSGLRGVGLGVDEFVFGFVSASYPFIACAFVLDDETREQGQEEVAELLSLYAECARSQRWPGLGDGYQLTGLPAWAKRSRELEVGYVD